MISGELLRATEIVGGIVGTLSAAQSSLPELHLERTIARATEALEQLLGGLEVAVGPPPVPISQVRLKPPPKPKEEPKEVSTESAWDPEPISSEIEVSRCRAMLLEIIRRAAHDWVLYRQHDRLHLKQIAEDAFIWLFEEEPGHHWATMRKEEDRHITGFINICEELDLDPEVVRAHVRKMDVKSIMSAGRPAERRHREVQEEHNYSEHGVSTDVDVQSYGDSPHRSYYENQYAISTLGYA